MTVCVPARKWIKKYSTKQFGTTYEKDSFARVLALADDADMQTKWRYFLKTLGNPTIDFSKVIRRIQQFLLPVRGDIATENELQCCLKAETSDWNPIMY